MSYISTGSRITSAEQDIIDQIAALGTAGQILAVNAGATGVEWISSGASGATTALDNLSAVAINAALVLGTSDAFALGSATKMWSDLFLADGAVINFNNGNMSITHSSGVLTISTGTLALGTGSITMTGSLAATGARVTKGWFTDVESTNMYTVGGTSLASTFSPIAGSASIVTVGTITSGAWNGTDIPVTAGGTGLSSISALSIWVANSANTITEVTVTAGQSIRMNGAGNAWEAFTPSAAVPTAITVADEAADTTSFIAFFTAATGDLGPKTNTNMTFNASTGVATFASVVLTTADINGGTLDGVAIGGASASTAVITTLSITSFGANWTNAGRTVADLGIVTTVDINGGTLDGVIIGGASAAAGTFTTIGGTTITASTGFALGDGDYVGVTGNEVLTFATAGTITVSGADFIIADGNGVVVGNGAQIVAGGITPEFQIIGTSTTSVDSTLLVANYSTTATSAAVVMFAKSDQGTPGSFALLDSGDTVGGLLWVADDGVDLTSELARIFVYVDGTSGSNDMPGRIVFSTASDSAAVVTDRWIIDSAGAFKPASDGAFDLGTTTLAINNIHLDTGATINFENGNAVITHSSAILTVSTGDLRVTSAGTNTASVVTVGGTQTLTAKTLTSPTINAGTLSGIFTLAESTSIDLDPAQGDQTWTGITRTGTAGAALAFGQLCYLAVADSRWELADADALATAGNVLLGICVLAAGADGNATRMLLYGNIQAASQFPAMTIGAGVYVGETAGAVQVAIPTGADNIIRLVGFALTADELFFCPSAEWQVTVA